MKKASGIGVMIALLASAPALGQMQVTSVSSNPTRITAGGAAVPLTAYGTGLSTVSGVRFRLNNGTVVTTVTGTIKSLASAGTSAVLELKASANATPDYYSLELLAGTARASVPVIIMVIGPTTTAAVSTTTFGSPVPAVSTLSPAVAAVGSGPDTLIVNGSDFATGAVVYWNGVARPTVRVSSTRLTTTLSTTDLAVPGNYSVTVVNPAPGGGTSSARTLSVTAPPKVLAFAIGGSANPARVWQGQPVPLHVQRSGPSPTHWRMEWTASGQPWRPMPVPTNYTVPAVTGCEGLLKYQLELEFATVVGADTLTSNVLGDGVVAKHPSWCNPLGVIVESQPRGISTQTDLVCDVGKVMSGAQFKVLNLGQSNQMITTIGVLCARSPAPAQMFGSGEGLTIPPLMCGSGQKSEPRISLQFTPLGFYVSNWVCAPNPQWLGATYNYDALYSKPVGGEIGGSGNPYIVRCPFNAVPIGLRVGRDQSYGRVASIGMLCAAPDTN